MATPARDRLIESTIGLIRRHGVHGTGLAEVLTHSGAARRSIYLNFPAGKDQLVTESVAAASEAIATVIRSLFEAGSTREVLMNFAAYWSKILHDSNFELGCPVAAGALAGEAAPSAVVVATAGFDSWCHQIAEGLTAEGLDAATALSLATMAVSSIEGAVMISIGARDTAALDRVCQHLVELLDLHLRALAA